MATLKLFKVINSQIFFKISFPSITLLVIILIIISSYLIPFLLDQKGRKNQGKTNRSARFPRPSHSEL